MFFLGGGAWANPSPAGSRQVAVKHAASDLQQYRNRFSGVFSIKMLAYGNKDEKL